MKKKFIVPVRYVLILFLLPLGACHKFVDINDLWHKHKPDCRIEKIIAYNVPFEAEPVVANFSYNQKGNPVLVTRNNPGTGNPHLRFYYDNKGRLSAYVGSYSLGPNAGYEFYSQYYYDNNNRIVSDSSYGLGDIINDVPQPQPPTQPTLRSWANYEYDAYNRVKKIDRFIMLNSMPFLAFSDEYFYNEDGNLSRHRYLTFQGYQESLIGPYDNKTNMNLTNKIWMFVERNYSRNNVKPAVAYNKSKLPTRYQLPSEQGRSFLYDFDLSDSEIFYDCKK
jgi:hypothetical protein